MRSTVEGKRVSPLKKSKNLDYLDLFQSCERYRSVARGAEDTAWGHGLRRLPANLSSVELWYSSTGWNTVLQRDLIANTTL